VTSFTIAPARSEDVAEIIALQDQNHVSTLPAESMADGFVTTQLTPDSIARMSHNGGIWVARAASGSLAAYACANGWDYYGDGPFQSSAKALLPRQVHGRAVTPENSFQYGPVCVAAPFRGQGVLEQIIGVVKTHYAPRFEFGITFIDTRNARSLAAHERKQGFAPLALLPAGNVTYHMLAFPTR
jgi:hypothetical protein